MSLGIAGFATFGRFVGVRSKFVDVTNAEARALIANNATGALFHNPVNLGGEVVFVLRGTAALLNALMESATLAITVQSVPQVVGVIGVQNAALLVVLQLSRGVAAKTRRLEEVLARRLRRMRRLILAAAARGTLPHTPPPLEQPARSGTPRLSAASSANAAQAARAVLLMAAGMHAIPQDGSDGLLRGAELAAAGRIVGRRSSIGFDPSAPDSQALLNAWLSPRRTPLVDRLRPERSGLSGAPQRVALVERGDAHAIACTLRDAVCTEVCELDELERSCRLETLGFANQRWQTAISLSLLSHVASALSPLLALIITGASAWVVGTPAQCLSEPERVSMAFAIQNMGPAIVIALSVFVVELYHITLPNRAYRRLVHVVKSEGERCRASVPMFDRAFGQNLAELMSRMETDDLVAAHSFAVCGTAIDNRLFTNIITFVTVALIFGGFVLGAMKAVLPALS